MSHSPW
ncbi:hypothetical protein YPPY07_1523, partial [Yersinia pestis PY-07]